MHKTHSSLSKELFIATITLKIPTQFTILLLAIPALLITHTNSKSFIFPTILPMKVRWWTPTSDAKYRMEHNLAAEQCYAPQMQGFED
jgi:hypothetical protein